MDGDGDQRREQDRQRILSHLRAHPGAADTAAGIAQWWLDGAPLAEVRAVLDELVAAGEVRCIGLVDGTTLYASGRIP